MSQHDDERWGQRTPVRRIRDLLWEQLVVHDALWGAYDGDPVDFLAEGREHPDLEEWCVREGLEPQRVATLMSRELAPLCPAFGGEPAPASPADLFGLGTALAGCCSVRLELLGPHLACLLVRGMPTPDHDDGIWPEQRLVASGDREPGLVALLRGYDEAMIGQPSRAVDNEQSLWQRLRRQLLAFRTRRFMGLQVVPLLSLSLQVEASQCDPALLREAGRLLLEGGEVVKNRDELQDLFQAARSALGREPGEPPDPGGSSWHRSITEIERQAAVMDQQLRPFGKRAVVLSRIGSRTTQQGRWSCCWPRRRAPQPKSRHRSPHPSSPRPARPAPLGSGCAPRSLCCARRFDVVFSPSVCGRAHVSYPCDGVGRRARPEVSKPHATIPEYGHPLPAGPGSHPQLRRQIRQRRSA